MISLIDTVTLAAAKLKTRRIMMFITILVAGLMFSILFATTILISGGLDSFNKFNQKTNQKILVAVHPELPESVQHPYANISADNQDRLNEIKAIEDAYIKEQEALAKKLKIDFDKKSIKSVLKKYQFSKHTHYQIDYSSPIAARVLKHDQQKYIAKATNNLEGLKRRAAPFKPLNFYQSQVTQFHNSKLKFMKNGKEEFFDDSDAVGDSDKIQHRSVVNSLYLMEDQALLKNFILPENTKRQHNKDAIPALVTAKEAQFLFGKQLNIPAQPTEAKQIVPWMIDLQQKINGHQYQVCYRNNSELERLRQALTQSIVLPEPEEGQPPRPQPKVVYNLPTQACGLTTIKKDNRSAADKKHDQQEIEKQRALGEYAEPHAEILTFQIVGILPEPPTIATQHNGLTEALKTLLTHTTQSGAIIPRQLYEQSGAKAKYDQILFKESASKFNIDTSLLEQSGFNSAIIEFSTVNDATNFISFLKNEGKEKFTDPNEPLKTDIQKEVYRFRSEIYGRNFSGLNDLQNAITRTVLLSLAIISSVATIILSLIMARVMSDSRHETAIFRAVGARRGDIAKVYLSYSLMIALRTIIIAALIGGLIALIVNSLLAPQLTVQAQISYSLFDNSQRVSLIGFNYLWILIIVGSIMTATILAVLPPMLRNVVRNPIKDIKDQ